MIFHLGQLIFLSLAQMDQWPQILNRKTAYIISAKLGLVSSTKVKRLFDLVVHEIYFPQQLGFDVFTLWQLSVQNLFPKILYVIDPELLLKHFFPN